VYMYYNADERVRAKLLDISTCQDVGMWQIFVRWRYSLVVFVAGVRVVECDDDICVSTCVYTGGLVPNVVVVNKKSGPVSWCGEHVLASTISNVSRACSVINSCLLARSCTCSMRTDSSAKTTISSSSKVTVLLVLALCRYAFVIRNSVGSTVYTLAAAAAVHVSTDEVPRSS